MTLKHCVVVFTRAVLQNVLIHLSQNPETDVNDYVESLIADRHRYKEKFMADENKLTKHVFTPLYSKYMLSTLPMEYEDVKEFELSGLKSLEQNYTKESAFWWLCSGGYFSINGEYVKKKHLPSWDENNEIMFMKLIIDFVTEKIHNRTKSKGMTINEVILITTRDEYAYFLKEIPEKCNDISIRCLMGYFD